MKTTKEKIEVMQAFERGEKIEVRGIMSEWEVFSKNASPVWDWRGNDYRVYVEPEVPDSIDWSHVHPDYKFMARDKDGDTSILTEEPEVKISGWCVDGGNMTDATTFTSLKIGNLPWNKSLIKRPEGV